MATWKEKYNKKYGYEKDKSHTLKDISKKTGVSKKGLQQIYNKGVGAWKTNLPSVRLKGSFKKNPNTKKFPRSARIGKQQWAMARVYSAVMGGKASKVDAKELKMEMGGKTENFDRGGFYKDYYQRLSPSNFIVETDNSAIVIDMEMAKGGNLNKSLTDKIEILKEEGYPQRQAIAIAYDMQKRGKLEKGGETDFDPDGEIKDKIIHNSGEAGGMLVGKRHSKGGIKAINKSTGQPLEMEGGEVVITRNAVNDKTKRSFEGKEMTNREILSYINESGGGVSFADGGNIPSEIIIDCDAEYKFGGKTMCGKDLAFAMGGTVTTAIVTDPNEAMSDLQSTYGFRDVFKEGGKTYDYESYTDFDEEKKLNEIQGVQYLMRGEYILVARHLYFYDKDLYEYYKYLQRINITLEDCNKFALSLNKIFTALVCDIKVVQKKDGKRSLAKYTYYPYQSSQMPSKYIGVAKINGIKMSFETTVDLVCCEGRFLERLSRKPIPALDVKNYYSFQVLIHELAHCLDFQSQFAQGKRPVVAHKDYFLNALIKIIKACKTGELPLAKNYGVRAKSLKRLSQLTGGNI